ncbi:MAG: T9SS type A sorting domain-containing protein [Saprospiraceae bacterium]
MKHILFTLLIMQFGFDEVIISQDCTLPVNWRIEKDTMPGFSKQHDLFFASDKIGYTTGVRGTLRKTIDGGKTWEIIHGLQGMGTRAIMRTLYFVDELVGFASGDGDYDPFNNIDNDAEFLRTYDGGLTWEKNFVDSIERVNDLKFFDDKHGLAICYAKNGTHPILETHDGGKSWAYLDVPVSSVEGSNFIFAGDRVLVYGEDKMNFTNHILFEIKEDGSLHYGLTMPPNKCSYYFYDEFIGFARTADKGYKTEDGGITWTEIEFPETNLWSVFHFADPNNGIVANTIYESDTSGWELWWYPVGLEVFVTEDGGENWVRFESGNACAIEGRLSHFAKNGEIHFHAGNYNGTYKFNFLNSNLKENDKIKIRPNPVTEYLLIDNLSGSTLRAEIFNLSGQKLYESEATSKINVEHLVKGYYILRLWDSAQFSIFNFVKL